MKSTRKMIKMLSAGAVATAATLFATAPLHAQNAGDPSPTPLPPAQQDRTDRDYSAPAPDTANRQRQSDSPLARDADRQPEQTEISERAANNIRGTLASATEAALTKGELESVVQRFTTASQQRLKEFAQEDHDDLDGRIDQLQRDWREKYGRDFNIRDRAEVYDPALVRISPGIMPEARLAGQRVQPQGDQHLDQPRLPQQQDQQHDQHDMPGVQQDRDATGAQRDATGAQRDATGAQRDATGAQRDATGAQRDGLAARPQAEQHRDRSKEVTVTLPAEFGLPQVHVPLVNEGTIFDSWRIDVPADLDGNKLKENILKQLTIVNEKKDQWPEDVNEAYRMVSHHVLMAVLNVDAQPGDEARPAGFRDRPEQDNTQQPRLTPLQPGQETPQPGYDTRQPSNDTNVTPAPQR